MGDMIPFRVSEAKQLILNISVGSPPQSVEVVADTGSPFTWFPTHEKMVGNPFHFSAERSSSWVKANDIEAVGYLDNSHCLAEKGEDIVSIGNLSVRIPLGVGSGHGCDAFSVGFLGLSKISDFLKAVAETSNPLIFSFSFKDNFTGEGENWFAIGGLADLKGEDIYWTHDKNEGLWSDGFQVDMPYISYNGQRFNFRPGHPVMVDTGATLTMLPEEVLESIWKIVNPPVS